ncbi:hypothetical protein DH86_00001413, partial [Scytalidium sp. 3C]
MNSWPQWLQKLLQPGVAHILNFQKGLKNQIQLAIDNRGKGSDQTAHKTIFNELLESDLPPREKSLERLKDEAIVIVGAGTDTVKYALSVACFHILNNPNIHKKLREELIQAMPNPRDTLALSELEPLPYLSAVIQEGYAVGMDPVHMHHNERVFPNSYVFHPERWITEDGSFDKKLKQYNVPFSRGTRQCAGMNLAYAEMYLALSVMFRRFELELWNTDESS